MKTTGLSVACLEALDFSETPARPLIALFGSPPSNPWEAIERSPPAGFFGKGANHLIFVCRRALEKVTRLVLVP